MITLKLGISPCPNDTFIFEALTQHKIDTHPFNFDLYLEDVETLNQWALKEKLDISKISFGVLSKIQNNYTLLDAGSALGNGVGPILISKKQIPLESLEQLRIGIPGENTSAHFLLKYAFPNLQFKEFLPFHLIEQAILDHQIDAGVIIHENRFTYQQKNLIALLDLGNYWEQNTKLPIPLGGIVLHKKYQQYQSDLNTLIFKSLEYALQNYQENLPEFITSNAQSMDIITMKKHINLYVNDFSSSLGNIGRQAIDYFLEIDQKHQK